MSALADEIEAAREALHQISRFAKEKFARDHARRALDRIATLEGMAAPGNDALDELMKDNAWRQSMNTMGSGDSPSPQQPTTEARDILSALDAQPGCRIDRHAWEYGIGLIDRFAAQRVTAATESEREARYKCEAALRAKDAAIARILSHEPAARTVG